MGVKKERFFTRGTEKEKRKQLRNNATPAEATLWRCLKNRQIMNLRFRRQHSVGPYIMDFYCPELKLCIELDGNIHCETMQGEADIIRTQFLNAEGITILRFSNETVFRNVDAIIRNIMWFKEHPQFISGYVKDIQLF